MALGIEHTNKDTVIEAYQFFAAPNWCIWGGRDKRAQYVDDDLDEGETKLGEFLDMIANSNTSTVYLLRVYKAGTKNVSNKTEGEGATTFMLSGTTKITKDQNGVTIIDRTRGEPAGSAALASRLDNLERDNKDLLERLHKQEIEMLRKEMDARISGLSNTPEPSMFDKALLLIDKVGEHPAILDKIAGIFQKRTAPPVAEAQYFSTEVPVNGTAQNSTDMNQEQTQDEQAPPVSDSEAEILNDRLEAALDSLEDKIGLEKLTTALEAIASKSTIQLKGLLLML